MTPIADDRQHHDEEGKGSRIGFRASCRRPKQDVREQLPREKGDGDHQHDQSQEEFDPMSFGDGPRPEGQGLTRPARVARDQVDQECQDADDGDRSHDLEECDGPAIQGTLDLGVIYSTPRSGRGTSSKGFLPAEARQQGRRSDGLDGGRNALCRSQVLGAFGRFQQGGSASAEAVVGGRFELLADGEAVAPVDATGFNGHGTRWP